MTAGLGLATLAIAAAAATFVLIIREIHLRALNTRVSNAVLGIPDRSMRSQDLIGWFSSIGMRYRRFYARGKSGTAESGPSIGRFQSSSNLADLDRRQDCQHVLVPDHCLLSLRSFREGHSSDVLIFTLVGVVIGIMGPRLILLVLQTAFRCCHSAGHAGCHRFAGRVQRSGNGPGERAATGGGGNEPDQSGHGPGLARSSR